MPRCAGPTTTAIPPARTGASAPSAVRFLICRPIGRFPNRPRCCRPATPTPATAPPCAGRSGPASLLATGPMDKVLEIGTGSGYQTAVLSQLVERVFSVERIKVLQDRAKERLVELNLRNVVFRWGDGWEGWPALAPYNGIIVTAVATDVPQALLDQLAPGGRLVIPVGSGEVQQLMLIIREDEGFSRHVLGAVRFVPLLNGPLA